MNNYMGHRHIAYMLLFTFSFGLILYFNQTECCCTWFWNTDGLLYRIIIRIKTIMRLHTINNISLRKVSIIILDRAQIKTKQIG